VDKPAVKHAAVAEALERLSRSREDEEAWELLYRRVWPRVLGYAYRLLGGQRPWAEDASQQALLRVVRYCDFTRVRTPEMFLAYVYSIARHCVRDLIARNRVEWSAMSIHPEELLCRTESHESPEGVAVLTRLMNELNALDPGTKELVKLLWEGRTLAEMADHLSITPSAAAVRVHRTRLRLRKHLLDKGISEDAGL